MLMWRLLRKHFYDTHGRCNLGWSRVQRRATVELRLQLLKVITKIPRFWCQKGVDGVFIIMGVTQVQGLTKLKRVNLIRPVSRCLWIQRNDERKHSFCVTQDWYISPYHRSLELDDFVPSSDFGDGKKGEQPRCV